MSVTYRQFDHRGPVPRAVVESIAAMAPAVFPGGRGVVVDEVCGELEAHAAWLLQVAEADGCVVGFKIGLRQRAWRFYSWLGGVDPAFRRRGIAGRLMTDQHRWCVDHGFRAVRTTTRNVFGAMLALNLKRGFAIIGTLDHNGEVSIVMQKALE